MAEVPPALRKVLRFWEWPFVAALAALMFWVRMLPYKPLVGGERAYYIGTDPFYHYREVLGIVEAFPRVPRWDPWTFYPYGTGTGQFGSLFDWLIALAAIVTSGGDPTPLEVQRVLGVAPAVLGALLIVPFYFLAKRMLGVAGAVVASLTLALLPGEFLIRSIAGYADHHVAEALMAVVAILGVVVAAERSHAARDRLVDLRDVRAYRGPLLWSLLAGVAIAAEFYTWPPAILFLVILTAWMSVVVILDHGHGRTPRGYVFAGSVAFATAGVLMLPAIETTFLGEFNTYSLLHPLACFLAAGWLVALHKAGKWSRMRGHSPWILPGVVVALGVAAFFGLAAAKPEVFASLVWGLSWISGIGVQRTTLTISEARGARFLCSQDGADYSCVANDFGLVAPLFVLLLVALGGYVLWKRRRMDILLLLWSLVMWRATTTQIRFSYYVALNIALVIGWLAARVSYGLGLESDETTAMRAAAAEAAAKGGKGRRTRGAERAAASGRWAKVGAVALVGLLLLPGNVFATELAEEQPGDSYFDRLCRSPDPKPGWGRAYCIRAADDDLVMWMAGLDWMRANTPDAGVDLGLVVERPDGLYEYPDESYGVLTWWDYGHWIETVALRPPVANPFQQAAPFASLYFTERDPARAEAMLDEWVQDKGPIRYVIIDDAIATGKFGAITVWANSQNASRPRYSGEWMRDAPFDIAGRGAEDLRVLNERYTQSMMGRLYDADADGLGTYRLVWEHPSYAALGSVVDLEQGYYCIHDIIPSRGCQIYNLRQGDITGYQEGTTVHLGGTTYAYDLAAQSRLKIFERVEGARLVGTASPGETVEAGVRVEVEHPDGTGRAFTHTVRSTAGPDGRFELRFPYSTTEPLTPEQRGTNLTAKGAGDVIVVAGSQQARVAVSDRAVLEGEQVVVTFG